MTQWLLLHAKTFKEEFLWREIVARQIECYFPRLIVKPVNPRSRKIKPYFPGYLFVQMEPDGQDVQTLRWLPGSLGWVTFGDDIASVPENIISGIRRHVETLNSKISDKGSHFIKGESLEIVGGVFNGYEAVFDSQLSGKERARVLLQLVHSQQMPAIIPSHLLRSKNQG
ncbi:MAG: hypothetical protein MUO40_09420 [Anaerolineaceae bacterium]|nr:hypothetical protein [Anaerolineaceae bacterium]